MKLFRNYLSLPSSCPQESVSPHPLSSSAPQPASSSPQPESNGEGFDEGLVFAFEAVVFAVLLAGLLGLEDALLVCKKNKRKKKQTVKK